MSITYSLVVSSGCLVNTDKGSFIPSILYDRQQMPYSADALWSLHLLALNLRASGTAMLRAILLFLSLSLLHQYRLITLHRLRAYNGHDRLRCS